MRDEIEKGSVAIQVEGSKVIIHILEKASFASGSADVRPSFVPVLQQIAGLIGSEDGTVTVSGHTDNIPISNNRFRSNWELSTSRAVSVAHELLWAAPLDESRFVVAGYADTQPQTDNETVENRTRNRRVDISISRGGAEDSHQSRRVTETMANMDSGETEQ